MVTSGVDRVLQFRHVVKLVGPHGDVGQVGVVVVVQQHDGFRGVVAGGRVGGLDGVTELDVLDGLGRAVGHEYRCGRVEAVLGTPTAVVVVALAAGRFVGG